MVARRAHPRGDAGCGLRGEASTMLRTGWPHRPSPPSRGRAGSRPPRKWLLARARRTSPEFGSSPLNETIRSSSSRRTSIQRESISVVSRISAATKSAASRANANSRACQRIDSSLADTGPRSSNTSRKISKAPAASSPVSSSPSSVMDSTHSWKSCAIPPIISTTDEHFGSHVTGMPCTLASSLLGTDSYWCHAVHPHRGVDEDHVLRRLGAAVALEPEPPSRSSRRALFRSLSAPSASLSRALCSVVQPRRCTSSTEPPSQRARGGAGPTSPGGRTWAHDGARRVVL